MTRRPPSQRTLGGARWIYELNRWDPAGPGPTRDDVAGALSRICRWGGNCREFYSVAQHSVMVSRLCPAPLALAGLLHDCGEMLVADMVRPAKRIMGLAYRVLEGEALRGILGVVAPDLDHRLTHCRQVDEADDLAMRLERRALFPPPLDDAWLGGPEQRTTDEMEMMAAYGDGISASCALLPLTPQQAEVLFLARWDELDAA